MPGGGATLFLAIVLLVGSFAAGLFFAGGWVRRRRSRQSARPSVDAWSTRPPDPPPSIDPSPWSTDGR